MANNKNIKNFIDDILFKPLLFTNKDSGQKNVVIVFNTDSNIRTTINTEGKKLKILTTSIMIFNVSETLMADQPVIEPYTIQDIDKFKDSIVILDDQEDYIEEINYAYEILMQFSGMLSAQLDNLTKCMSTVQQINREVKKNVGQILMSDDYSDILDIALKTVDGKSLDLNEETVGKLAGLLQKITHEHREDNFGDKNVVKRLKDKLEYMIIEILPNNFKIGEININMEAIVDNIIQNSEENE